MPQLLKLCCYYGYMNDAQNLLQNWLGSGSLNLFGRPFAGKDTQGKMLAEFFDGILVSSGDILRHASDNQRLQEIMAAGAIIPSDLFEEVMVPYLKSDALLAKPLILSEVGRVSGEEQVVLRATESSGHHLKAVIHLNMPEEEVWRRFDTAVQTGDRGQRADDNREVLQTRLDAYREKVLPVIDFYKISGLLIEVDGTKPREEVFANIIKSLQEKSTP